MLLICALITGETFVPLGGQHIAFALWLLYAERRSAGTPECDIPITLRYVMAEVLCYKTPLGICQTASGEHQRLQHSVRKTKTVDALRHFRMAALQRIDMGLPPEMTDEELWLQIRSLGVPLDDPVPGAKAKAPTDMATKVRGLLQACYVMHAHVSQKKNMVNT